MQKCFYINGKSSADFHIFINNDTYLNSPQIDYTEYTVPAVDGSLVAYNKRLGNVIRKFDCYIKKDVYASLNALKKLLYQNTGYLKIESDYDPTTYQYGFLAEGIEVTPFQSKKALSVQFTLYFSCKPQKYLKDTKSMPLRVGGRPSSNFSSLLARDNEFIQAVFSKLPIDMVPDGNVFILFFGDLNPVSPLSNVVGSWSGGDINAIFAETTDITPYKRSDLVNVLAYSNKGIDVSSVTIGENHRVVYIFPFKAEGTFTLGYTNGNGVTRVTETVDLSSTVGKLFNESAVGFNIKNLNIGYTFKSEGDEIPTDFLPNAVYVGSNGREALIEVKFDKMPTEMIELLNANYLTLMGSQYYVNTRIDLERMEVYAIADNMTDLSLNDYCTIKGNADGTGDEITFAGFYVTKAFINAGTIFNGFGEVDWWTL